MKRVILDANVFVSARHASSDAFFTPRSSPDASCRPSRPPIPQIQKIITHGAIAELSDVRQYALEMVAAHAHNDTDYHKHESIAASDQ